MPSNFDDVDVSGTLTVGGVRLPGAASSGLTIQQDGVAIAGNPKSTLNFITPVTATTGGAGLASIALVVAKTNVSVANSPYTVLTTDDVLLVDTSGGPVSLNLPNPASFVAAKTYRIIDKLGTFDQNACTLQPFAAELISGVAGAQPLGGGWDYAFLTCDGTNWFLGAA